MEDEPQLMLFARVEKRWVFYGSYYTDKGTRDMIARLIRRHHYTTFMIFNIGAPEGQGIFWSSSVPVATGMTFTSPN